MVTRRLRVLVLTTSYPTPDSPVAGVFVREHARAVLPHCDVVLAHLERADVRRLEVEPVRGEEFPAWRVRYPRSPRALSYLHHLRAGRRAIRLAGEVDVVHAHFFLAALPAALVARSRPLVVTEHWGIFLHDNPDTLAAPLRALARYALNRARIVLPVSGPLQRALREAGVRAPMRVVPNVVDEALFHPPAERQAREGPVRLLTVGLFYDGAKGVDLLLEAAATLRRRRGDGFRLDVVGDGIERAGYEERSRRLGLTGLVTFHGLLPKREVAELMRGADLYVLASRYDNNPVVLLEALACGLPAVATDVGGVAEILDGSGLLASPDADSIAARLEAALDELGRFDRAAIARRAREHFGSQAVGRTLARVYAEALGTDR